MTPHPSVPTFDAIVRPSFFQSPAASLSALLLIGGGAVGCATTSAADVARMEKLQLEVENLRGRQAAQERELARLRERLEGGNRPAPAMAQVARPAPVSGPAMLTTEGEAPVSAQQLLGQGAAAPRTAGGGYRLPQNLPVVAVEPEAQEFFIQHHPDSPATAPQGRTATAAPRRRGVDRSAGAPTELATQTPLREPTEGEVAGAPVDTALRDVEWTAARNAPDAEPLERFATRYPADPRSDDALFEAAIRHEKASSPERAASLFKRAFDEHPAGNVAADSLLHLASCQLQLRRSPQARTTLQQLVQRFPGSPQAEAAQTRLADLAP